MSVTRSLRQQTPARRGTLGAGRGHHTRRRAGLIWYPQCTNVL